MRRLNQPCFRRQTSHTYETCIIANKSATNIEKGSLGNRENLRETDEQRRHSAGRQSQFRR